MRVAMSHGLGFVGRALRRAVGRRRTELRWRIDHGPEWANCIGQLVLDGRRATATFEQTEPDTEPESAGPPQLVTVFEVDLTG
jgi:hypothetical protein